MTCGLSRKIARRTSMANSSFPGTTGKYVNRPRCRLPGSGNDGSRSSGITQRFFAERLHDGRFERRRLMAAVGGQAFQLNGETPDIDAVTHSVALVGGVSLLQKFGHVSEDAVLGERQIFLEDLVLFVALGEVDKNLRLQPRVYVFGQLEGRCVIVHGRNEPK